MTVKDCFCSLISSAVTQCQFNIQKIKPILRSKQRVQYKEKQKLYRFEEVRYHSHETLQEMGNV